MKLLALLSFVLFFSCATHKNQSKVDTKNMRISVEIIVNKMPTTDSGSNNYAIVTLDNGGDSLVTNWRVSRFTLKDESNEILQKQALEDLSMEFKGKGKTQMKYNVRNLPSSIPSTVIIDVTLEAENGGQFETTTEPISPMIVQ